MPCQGSGIAQRFCDLADCGRATADVAIFVDTGHKMSVKPGLPGTTSVASGCYWIKAVCAFERIITFLWKAMQTQAMTLMNFSSMREAILFARDLTKDTADYKIKAQGLSVYGPCTVVSRTRKVYADKCQRLVNHSLNIGTFAAVVLELLGDAGGGIA